jgi:hypothetical protein
MEFDLFSFAGGETASLYRQQVEFLFGDDFKVVIQSLEIIIAISLLSSLRTLGSLVATIVV